MAQWATFAGITGVVLVSLLVLSHLTQSSFTDGAADRTDASVDRTDRAGESVDRTDRDDADSPFESTPFESARPQPSATDPDAGLERDAAPGDETGSVWDGDPTPGGDHPRGDDGDSPHGDDGDSPRAERVDPTSLSTAAVLANVALSQGLFAVVLLGAAVYADVPAAAFGVAFTRTYLETGLVVGTAAGVVLYAANEVAAALATRTGFDHDEGLRELLAPDSAGGWLVLLVAVLPLVALFEELLFRAALIGALSAGFGVSPWLLAVASSVAFALGHGVQGSVGVLVTGALGFVLAATFVLTESFLVVVVAHYWINALEFAVHEGFGIEWADALER